MMVAIVGMPGTGKTTLARELSEELGLAVVHADDHLNGMGSKNQPERILAAIAKEGRCIAEGVGVVRCFRRGLCPDAVIVCFYPFREPAGHWAAKWVPQRIAEYEEEFPDTVLVRTTENGRVMAERIRAITGEISEKWPH